ncbi:hypothetical protein FACS189496_4210 [Bacilli bacterium]|nr:hypothetical protein FACS189496_4210 [Bacilli bacterium]
MDKDYIITDSVSLGEGVKGTVTYCHTPGMSNNTLFESHNTVIPTYVRDANGDVYKVAIGESAFDYDKNTCLYGTLKIVGFESIGKNAFYEARITSVDISSESELTIYDRAFDECKTANDPGDHKLSINAVGDININGVITDTGARGAFRDSNFIKNAEIISTEGNISIGEKAFDSSINIESISITANDGSVTIGNEAFNGNSVLAKLETFSITSKSNVHIGKSIFG